MPLEGLPRLGLGTYSDDDREQWVENVRTALEAGYRFVDTAQSYGNEEYVGEGIARSSIDREDVFLATKVATGNLAHEDVLESTRESVEGLGVDTIDLLYVHWPTHTYDAEETLSAFDELRDEGTIRHVGVSNFEPDQIDEARDVLDAPIVANQVEMHPLLPQKELVDYAREHDHWLVAYSPLAKGAVFDVPEIRDIAEKHDASPAQVTLAWLLFKENVAAIPKASSEAHMRDNLAAREIDLDEADVSRIDSIEEERRLIDPDFGPWNR